MHLLKSNGGMHFKIRRNKSNTNVLVLLSDVEDLFHPQVFQTNKQTNKKEKNGNPSKKEDLYIE
jgi:hypothetical protein